MSTEPANIQVAVVYALPTHQHCVSLSLPPTTTVSQAVALSGVLQQFPEVGSDSKLGIFGKLVSGDTVLRDRDRVEIYRPLIADPKEVRRQRAAAGKSTKKVSIDD